MWKTWCIVCPSYATVSGGFARLDSGKKPPIYREPRKNHALCVEEKDFSGGLFEGLETNPGKNYRIMR